MKPFLFTLAVLAPVTAQAASLEQNYFASRDAYIAKFSQTNSPDDFSRQYDLALDELARLLRPIVGTVAIKGLSAQPKSNVNTLSRGDSGFGQLDGLVFASPDEKTRVVATTTALLDHWLREHDDVPRPIDAALKSEAFYTQALTDAAMTKYADIPVAKPAGANFAVAVLGLRSNGMVAGTPNEVDVAVVRDARVFVVSAPVTAKIDMIPACKQAWDASMTKPVDESDHDGLSRRENEADAAFVRCFVDQARNHRFFPAVAKQAQRLIGLLPTR
jgi:hypothetical protein